MERRVGGGGENRKKEGDRRRVGQRGGKIGDIEGETKRPGEGRGGRETEGERGGEKRKGEGHRGRVSQRGGKIEGAGEDIEGETKGEERERGSQTYRETWDEKREVGR